MLKEKKCFFSQTAESSFSYCYCIDLLAGILHNQTDCRSDLDREWGSLKFDGCQSPGLGHPYGLCVVAAVTRAFEPLLRFRLYGAVSTARALRFVGRKTVPHGFCPLVSIECKQRAWFQKSSLFFLTYLKKRSNRRKHSEKKKKDNDPFVSRFGA